MKRDLYGELMGRALNRSAPPGHFAAYIRPDESDVLRSMGGGVAPDGGQNMYNGMPAYFSGISAVSGNGGGGVSFGYGDGGVSIPSYSVDAPSVSAPDQGFIDQMNAAVANVRSDQGATVAEEFAQAQANAQAQADAQAQAAANIRSGGIAAAAEQARSQGIADILADQASIGSMYDPSKVGKGPTNLEIQDILSGKINNKDIGSRTGFIGPAPYGGGTMANAAQVKGGYFTGDGTTSSRDSDDSGWVFTDATTEAAKNANQGFLASLIPGRTTVTQDPMTGAAVKGYGFSKGEIAAALFSGTPIGQMATMYNMTRGAKPTEPTMMSRGQFKSSLQPSYNDDFNMDDISLPSPSDEELMAATQTTDPTDPANDPTPPAVKEYYKPPQWVLDRLAQNLAYGPGRIG